MQWKKEIIKKKYKLISEDKYLIKIECQKCNKSFLVAKKPYIKECPFCKQKRVMQGLIDKAAEQGIVVLSTIEEMAATGYAKVEKNYFMQLQSLRNKTSVAKRNKKTKKSAS